MKLVFSIRLELSVLGDGIIDINGISSLIESSGTILRAALIEILTLLAIFKTFNLLRVLIVNVLTTLELLVIIVIVGIDIILDKLIN